MDKVRVLRILEYVGDREWVENQMKNGGVPMVGQRQFSNKFDGTITLKGIIKSTIIDQFPEVIESEVVEKNSCSNCENYWYHCSSTNTERFCFLEVKEECQSNNLKYHTLKKSK